MAKASVAPSGHPAAPSRIRRRLLRWRVRPAVRVLRDRRRDRRHRRRRRDRWRGSGRCRNRRVRARRRRVTARLPVARRWLVSAWLSIARRRLVARRRRLISGRRLVSGGWRISAVRRVAGRRGIAGRIGVRGGRQRPLRTDAPDQQREPTQRNDDADDQTTDAELAEDRCVNAQPGLGLESGRSVRIHQHGFVVAAENLPGERRIGAARLGHPECLVTRGGRLRRTVDRTGGDLEWAEVDPADLLVRGTGQVRVDLVGRPDAVEQRLRTVPAVDLEGDAGPGDLRVL